MSKRSVRRVIARHNWDRLKVSFWFIPLVMSLGAILLARVMYAIDVRVPNEVLQFSHFFLSSGTVSEMRAILLSIGTTVLATAGVVFSLLTLPLSTVAAQYGSRLLRVYLGDRTTQFVLGMFVFTFIYCLTAAATLPSENVQPEGPQITTTVGLALMVLTFASLILLIQHISTTLQAPVIAAAAGAQLLDVVQAEHPDPPALVSASIDTNSLEERDAQPVTVKETGYIQYIDPESLLAIARKDDLVIRFLRKPGDFVYTGETIAQVWASQPVKEEDHKLIRRTIEIGNRRTPTQDIEYAVLQLEEMAVRAMSPAINDPFTAMTCLDHIVVGLSMFIHQGERSPYIYDADGRLCIEYSPANFEELLHAAFDLLRHCSADNAVVLLHMLNAIDIIGQATQSPADRQKLIEHVILVQAESHAAALIEHDRDLIQHNAQALQLRLKPAVEAELVRSASN